MYHNQSLIILADLVPETPEKSTEQHQNVIEETKHEDEEKLQEKKPKEQEENSLQKLGDGNLDEEAATAEKSETEENTVVAIKKQEDAEDTSLQPVCVDKVDDKTSEISAGPAATPAASPEGEKSDREPAENGLEAKSIREDETSESRPNKGVDETVVPGDAEAAATAVGETLQMKAEPSEGQEALDLEEAPADEEEGRQKGESEDGAAAENPGELTAAAADITNEHKMEISENNDGDLIKEEVEVVAEENTQEKKGEEEEKSRKSLETDEEMEKKSEELIREQDNPIKSQEITDTKVEDKEEVAENEEDVSELNVDDSATEDRAGDPTEKPSSQRDEDAGAGKAQESGNTEKDEDGECTTAEDKTDMEKGGTANEDERADEEQRDEVEQEEKDDKKTEVESDKVAADETAGGEAEQIAEASNHGVENIEEESEAVNTASEVAAETPTNAAEAPAENKDPEIGGGSQSAEVDVENGEISVRAHNQTHDDQGEAPTGAEGEVNRAGNTEDEVQAEEPDPVEAPERQGTTGDGADKRGGDEAELPSLADVLETLATEEDKSDGKQDGSVVNKLKVEKPGGEIKEEDRNHEGEAKQDENGNVSEPGDGKQNSDSIKQDNDVESNVTGFRAAISEDPPPEGAGSDEEPGKFKEPSELHEADKDLDTDTAATDLPTSKGETEEVEEVSKTSEEGASVLVKPQAQTSPPKDERVAAVIVANEDNVDLVSNWVNTHQASRFFETFVEPLDDLKEPHTQESHVNPSGERSASPVKRVSNSEQGGSRKATTEESVELGLESSRSKDGEQGESDPVEDLPQVQEEQQKADVMPEGDKDGQQNGQELVEDLLQAQEEPEKADEMPKADNDKAPTDKDLVEDLLQMQEELDEADLMPEAHKEGQTNARDIVEELLEEQEEPQKADILPEADNDGAGTEKNLAGDPLQTQEEPEKADVTQEGDKDMMPEEPCGSRMSQQEHTDTSKTEVESIAGTQRSVTSSTAESVSRLQTGQKITESTVDLSAKQRTVELPDPGLAPGTEEHQGCLSSSENLLEMKQSALKDIQDIFKPSEGVMEISDLTAGRNHEETHQDPQDQTQTKPPGEGIVRRDVRLIEDIQRTLSKDRLSPFTVDGTLLDQNSYPMLSAVRTESKH